MTTSHTLTDTTETSAAFLDHVDAQRQWAATRVGLDLLEDHGPLALLDQLLVPVAHETGRRWMAGEYSVAQEHLVTGLVDELMGVANVAVHRPGEGSPRVTLVCAEGEWHASAARMTSLRLRAEGWDVRFLGATVPAAELETHLRAAAPDALLISCTMAAALPGAAAMADVAHRVGVPVVAGGAAFSVADGAAHRVGVDSVVANSQEAGRVVARWQESGRPAAPEPAPDPTGERSTFAIARRDLVRSVVSATTGPFRPEDEAEVDGLLSTLDAALLLDDLAVLDQHMAWLAERESVRQVLPVPLAQVVDTLTRSMPPHLRMSRSYLMTAANHLRD